MDMQISQRIFCSDSYALSKLEEEKISKFVKIKKNIIYPLNPMFPENFFRAMKLVLDENE